MAFHQEIVNIGMRIRATYDSLSPRDKEVMSFVLSGLLNKKLPLR
jgi:FixJ family two-component response regulator